MNSTEQSALSDSHDTSRGSGTRSIITKTRASAKKLLSRSPAFKRLDSTSTTQSRTPSKSFEADYKANPPGDLRKKDEYQEIELDPWLQVDGSSALVTDSLPPPEIVGRPKPRARKHTTFRGSVAFVWRNWWQEWILVFTAVIILMTIIVVLRVLNKQPQPEWKLGVNLNTLIAVLATVFRSSLVTIVEEVISQAKWSWQQGHRTASDLAYFDRASRGPLGALLLHFRIPGLLHRKSANAKYRGATVIACAVTVLSLAVGAFTQQALKAVPCRFPITGSNATIPVAKYAHPFFNTSRIGNTARDFDVTMKGQIASALGNPSFTPSKFLKGCSTGNCTFQSFGEVTHVTSGFCSRCVETTNLLKLEDNFPIVGRNGTEYVKRIVRLGTRPSLILSLDPDHTHFQGLAANVYTEAYQPLNLNKENLKVVINVASITKAPCSTGTNCSGFWDNYLGPSTAERQVDWTGWNTVSVQCGLYPCARHMKAEAKNGDFVETVIREQIYPPDPPTPLTNRSGVLTGQLPAQFIAPCWINNTRYDTAPTKNTNATYNQNLDVIATSPCAYGVSLAFSNRMRAYVSSIANSNCSIPVVDGIPIVKCLSGSSLDSPFCRDSVNPLCTADMWWVQNLFNSGNTSFESISSTAENLALALTDSARAEPFQSVSFVPGTIWSSTVCTEFNWPWIWFSVILLALTVYALTSISLKTALDKDEPPIWKSSTLPIIFGQEGSHDSPPFGKSLEELSRSAKEHGLILVEHEGQWGLKIIGDDQRREA